MNITQIEETVKKLASDVLNSSVKKDQFIYELMAAYGHRKTTVSRIKSGERNLAKGAGEVRAKRHIYFKHSDSNKVFSDIDDMKKEPSVTREKIRFIIATDFNQFVAVDTRTHDTLDIEFGELGKHFDFFLPWAGMEKAVYQGDNPADVKAAEKMARLFDLIKADNFSEENKNDTAALHSLNVFLTRLLFCFFAEDTGIFTDNQFSAELESHTKADGSDVNSYLNRLFEVLNTSKEDRHDLPDYLAKFEYVNGGLFADDIASPKFSTKSRRMLIECGSELDWSGINPDIFGSMIQAVVHPDQRGGMGMHYTSVINIMKVIEPLFLDDLYAELENIAENIDPKLKPSRLRKLHDRIADIKIFDPACGSGNFLIIAFKELRKLEMEIIRQLQDFKRDESQNDFFDEVSLNSSFSRIKLSQFYGIELDDFAHEVAILSLWLSEHQMNVDFKAEFGECEPSLPLKESGHIIAANATRIDWEQVCPNKGEVYVLGNPPYLGARNQSSEQKEDMKQVFNNRSEYKNSDYVSCWILKASDYIANTKTRFAFVTTSSIAQGEQVSYIWPYVFNNNQEIIFAHQPFKWVNNAKQAAGIICVIIGVSSVTPKAKKILFDSKTYRELNNISPYLTEGSNQVIYGTKENISGLPKMVLGSMARDGGNLILSNEEHKVIVTAYPSSKELFRRFYGSKEFIRGEIRWGLWINDAQLPLALNIPDISNRIKKVYDFRCASKAKTTNQYAKISHKFAQRCLDESQAIIIPRVSSERRDYIPIGFLDKGSIISDSALALYQAEVYMFSLLSSRMHNVWVKAVGGYLGTSIRYSVSVCFNTFILPSLSDTDKENLTNSALKILECREAFPDKTFSELYDPDLMPNSLKQVHAENDSLVEACYRSKEFSSNEERLEYLFSLYGQMTGGPNA